MKQFQQTREVVAYAQKYISGETVDLGAGYAKYRETIKKKATKYVAFDMAPGKNIDVVGDVLNLPFEAQTFDTVISTQVLEHVEKPWVMVGQIRRVLRDNGICILMAPFLTPFHACPNDYFRYTMEGMKSLFRNEGFEIIECFSYGGPFIVFSEFIRLSWFSPLEKRKRGSWKITHFIANLAKFLNKFTKNKIIYAQVCIVAKKLPAVVR
jgi:ubiquinone/menaquinone biosynthesis C-methylase UbiE